MIHFFVLLYCDRIWTETAIKCKLAKFEPPDFGEGIDEIYDVKLSENGFDVRRRNEKE